MDEKIKKDVVDQLYWDARVDASAIQVDVSEGKVVLTGSVPTYEVLGLVEESVLHVPGVVEVTNDLDVEHPNTDAIPEDADLRKNIKQLLEWNPEVDSEHVEASVDRGVVILEGTVSSYWQKLKARELVGALRGVVDIVNNLAVVSTESVLDRAIADGITKALERDARISEDTVNVRVEDGVVSLVGQVPDMKARKAAEDIVSHSAGVIEVYNELGVAGSPL